MSNSIPETNSSGGLYWKAQIKLVSILGLMGINYQASSRLPLFQLHRRLTLINRKGDVDERLIETALSLVTWLTRARTRGMEPPHKDGEYVV